MPKPQQPSQEVVQKALDMLGVDAAFDMDDSLYTPSGAMEHYVNGHRGGSGGEDTGVREPRKPLLPSAAGAIAIEGVNEP